MVFFQHFFYTFVATSTFPCWKMMRLFVNVYSNHGRNKTNNRHKCKYFNPDGIWVFKHNYAILLLRILIVTNKLTTTNTIANVTGIAHTIEDNENILKKQYTNAEPTNDVTIQNNNVHLNLPFGSSALAVAHAAKQGIVNMLKAMNEIQPCHVIPVA